MALTLRTLPGDVGYKINAYVNPHHVDAIEWQRQWRQELHDARSQLSKTRDNSTFSALLIQICGTVHLIASKNINVKYEHAIRIPDFRRVLIMLRILSFNDQLYYQHGGLPKKWRPMKFLIKVPWHFRHSPLLTNDYEIEVPDSMPWENSKIEPKENDKVEEVQEDEEDEDDEGGRRCRCHCTCRPVDSRGRGIMLECIKSTIKSESAAAAAAAESKY